MTLKLSRNQKFTAIIGLGLLMLIGVGAVSYRYTSAFISSVEERKASYEILATLESMIPDLKNIESAERLFVTSGQDGYLDAYNSARKLVRSEVNTLRTLTAADPAQRHNAALLEPLVLRRLESTDTVVETRKSRGRWAAEKVLAAGGDRRLSAGIVKTVSAMKELESGRVKQLSKNVKTGARETISIILAGNLLALFVVVVGGVVFQREFIRRRQAEEAMKRFSQSVEQTADLVVVTDREGTIEYVNKAVEETSGYSAAELIGKGRDVWQSGKHDAKFFQDMQDTVLGGRQFQAVVTNRKKNGALFYLHETTTPLKDGDGQITHFVSTGQDITSQKALEERLDYLVHFDALTGMPNRNLFTSRLKQGTMQGRAGHTYIAVLVIDIDRFKSINDVFGFGAGDDMLKVLAERLSASVQVGDTVGRIGSDEFGVVLHGLARPADAVPVVKEIMKRISETIVFKREEIILTPTIGIAIYPTDGKKAETLMKKADTALSKAKAHGRNNYQFYTTDINVKASEVIRMEKSLFTALQNEEYLVYYQPYCELTTKKVAGVEALIKWKSGTHGLVSPTQFIPTLEDTGMIIDVGEWVLKTACRQIKEWGNGNSAFPVSVNLSLIQFRHKYLVDMVADTIKTFGIDPKRLALEITENIFMDDMDFANSVLKKLKGLGVSISVDDFGTGYSSLSYLKKLSVDNIKIDISFVQDVTIDPDVASIITAIVAMARSLNLKTIAEGVETEEQQNILRLLRCDMGQGYYFSPALLPKDLEKQLF
jgi:diguanylate cyclase (GGDEF)-like protein/PAS domain S-box-containing protein